MKKYSVYVLIKDGLPVYVGCSTNVFLRAKSHKKTKVFDSYYIIESFKNKKEALAAERCIIHFYALFRQHDWYNGENVSYQIVRNFGYNFKNLKNGRMD